MGWWGYSSIKVTDLNTCGLVCCGVRNYTVPNGLRSFSFPSITAVRWKYLEATLIFDAGPPSLQTSSAIIASVRPVPQEQAAHQAFLLVFTYLVPEKILFNFFCMFLTFYILPIPSETSLYEVCININLVAKCLFLIINIMVIDCGSFSRLILWKQQASVSPR